MTVRRGDCSSASGTTGPGQTPTRGSWQVLKGRSCRPPARAGVIMPAGPAPGVPETVSRRLLFPLGSSRAGRDLRAEAGRDHDGKTKVRGGTGPGHVPTPRSTRQDPRSTGSFAFGQLDRGQLHMAKKRGLLCSSGTRICPGPGATEALKPAFAGRREMRSENYDRLLDAEPERVPPSPSPGRAPAPGRGRADGRGRPRASGPVELIVFP